MSQRWAAGGLQQEELQDKGFVASVLKALQGSNADPEAQAQVSRLPPPPLAPGRVLFVTISFLLKASCCLCCLGRLPQDLSEAELSLVWLSLA